MSLYGDSNISTTCRVIMYGNTVMSFLFEMENMNLYLELV
jgi:hypothetical protein